MFRVIDDFDLYWIKLGYMIFLRGFFSIDEDGKLRTVTPIIFNLN